MFMCHAFATPTRQEFMLNRLRRSERRNRGVYEAWSAHSMMAVCGKSGGVWNAKRMEPGVKWAA